MLRTGRGGVRQALGVGDHRARTLHAATATATAAAAAAAAAAGVIVATTSDGGGGGGGGCGGGGRSDDGRWGRGGGGDGSGGTVRSGSCVCRHWLGGRRHSEIELWRHAVRHIVLHRNRAGAWSVVVVEV